MAAPKDSQHNNAGDESGYILEGCEERFDIVGDLLRGDHQHRDCEGKRCIDESFQSRHRDAAQPKSAKPRQRIQIRW